MFVIKHAKTKKIKSLNIDLYHDIHQLRPYMNLICKIASNSLSYGHKFNSRLGSLTKNLPIKAAQYMSNLSMYSKCYLCHRILTNSCLNRKKQHMLISDT